MATMVMLFIFTWNKIWLIKQIFHSLPMQLLQVNTFLKSRYGTHPHTYFLYPPLLGVPVDQIFPNPQDEGKLYTPRYLKSTSPSLSHLLLVPSIIPHWSEHLAHIQVSPDFANSYSKWMVSLDMVLANRTVVAGVVLCTNSIVIIWVTKATIIR